MRSLSTLVTLLALTTPSVLAGSSCVAFDTAWNLLAFGFNGKDYNAGTSDTWASGMSLKQVLLRYLTPGLQVLLRTSQLRVAREFSLTLCI